MTNEFIILGTIVLDLSAVILCYSLGRKYLVSLIVINLAMVSLSSPKTGEFFGFVGSPQTIFYSAIFLGTDILSEFHGKEEGYEAVWNGFLGLVAIAVLGKIVIWFNPTPDSASFGKAFNTVFGGTWRVALGSFVAYLISQRFDVWFFHKIKSLTEGKYLWFRNILSTSTSQLIDTVIFFPIAFGGIITELGQVMFVAYIMKIVVALVDTPFIYFVSYLRSDKAKVSLQA